MEKAKYTHDRTRAPPPTERRKGVKVSTFLITINPNKVASDPNSPVYHALKQSLFRASEFLLKKKNILSMIKFVEEPPISREVGLSRIVEIRDRDAGVEFGTKNRRLHAHLVFVVEHTTKIHISPEWLRQVVPVFFEGLVKPTSVHINVRGGNGRNPFVEYAKKNAGLEEDPSAAFSLGDGED